MLKTDNISSFKITINNFKIIHIGIIMKNGKHSPRENNFLEHETDKEK